MGIFHLCRKSADDVAKAVYIVAICPFGLPNAVDNRPTEQRGKRDGLRRKDVFGTGNVTVQGIDQKLFARQGKGFVGTQTKRLLFAVC